MTDQTVVPLTPQKAGEIAEAILLRGDYSKLTERERASLIVRVCESLGLNPLTRPIEFINLSGKLVPYVKKDGTDQLRKLNRVSVVDLHESERDGVFIVTAKVQNGEGRTDMAKGAVKIEGLKGDALANALMKAETKAKRRATLSICGLGFLDETELETIPNAHEAWGEREGQALVNAARARPPAIEAPLANRQQNLLAEYEGKARECKTLSELAELHDEILRGASTKVGPTRSAMHQYVELAGRMIGREKERIEADGRTVE